MNPSHYYALDPEMDRGAGQKRREAGRKSLPPDDHTAVRRRHPGLWSLRLEPRDIDREGAATRVLGGPDAVRELRPEATGAPWLTAVLRVIPSVGGDDPRPLPRPSPRACPPVDGVQQRPHVGPLVPMGRGGRGARGLPAASGRRWMRSPLPWPPR